MNKTPHFTHDCSKCTHLGTIASKLSDDGVVDLYVCNGSYIVRYGDDGPEYTSGPDWSIRQSNTYELHIALAIHQNLGE